jgi:hypothetical protein
LRFFFFFNERTEEVPKVLLANEEVREAIGYVERGAYTKEQLDTYYKVKIDTMTASSMLEVALLQGEAIGLKKGEAIGLEKGEAIGLEKGEAERSKLQAHIAELEKLLEEKSGNPVGYPAQK